MFENNELAEIGQRISDRAKSMFSYDDSEEDIESPTQ